MSNRHINDSFRFFDVFQTFSQSNVTKLCPGSQCTFAFYGGESLYHRYIFVLQLCNLLVFLWLMNFTIALGQCTLAGAFASYYWALRKPADIPPCPLASSFGRALRYVAICGLRSLQMIDYVWVESCWLKWNVHCNHITILFQVSHRLTCVWSFDSVHCTVHPDYSGVPRPQSERYESHLNFFIISDGLRCLHLLQFPKNI